MKEFTKLRAILFLAGGAAFVTKTFIDPKTK